MGRREQLKTAQRWVIKIGSALLTNNGQGLDKQAIGQWVDQIAWLRQHNKEVILVSSGAVAEGMSRLGWRTRPHAIHDLQAAAAVGQMGLVEAYESQFRRHGIHTAQILLTHQDLTDRMRYLNARSTLNTLLKLSVIPIVNENDTVVTDEIRFGDNDTLGALVTNLVTADLLVILTDQAGLYDQDPRINAAAKLITEVKADDPQLLTMASGSTTAISRGGMITKVKAARLAARSGAYTLIAGGREPQVLQRIAQAEELGTVFISDSEPLIARKQWLAGHLQIKGQLILDAGAVKVLKTSGKSLLPVGVKSVSGSFNRGEVVSCMDEAGEEVARGLVNYNAAETRQIIGCTSDQILTKLGYVDEPELIHRDNMVLV